MDLLGTVYDFFLRIIAFLRYIVCTQALDSGFDCQHKGLQINEISVIVDVRNQVVYIFWLSVLLRMIFLMKYSFPHEPLLAYIYINFFFLKNISLLFRFVFAYFFLCSSPSQKTGIWMRRSEESMEVLQVGVLNCSNNTFSIIFQILNFENPMYLHPLSPTINLCMLSLSV